MSLAYFVVLRMLSIIILMFDESSVSIPLMMTFIASFSIDVTFVDFVTTLSANL